MSATRRRGRCVRGGATPWPSSRWSSGTPFFGEVAHAVERRAAENGLFLVLASSDGDPVRESQYIDMFVQQRVRGLILASGTTRPEDFELLAARGIPTVLVDAYAPSDRFSSVAVDDALGTRRAVIHLIEQGCRSIAFVGGPESVRQIGERLDGARKAVREHPGVTLEVIATEERIVTAGLHVGEVIAARRPAERPDGIVAANDSVTLGGPLDGAVQQRDTVPLGSGAQDVVAVGAEVLPVAEARAQLGQQRFTVHGHDEAAQVVVVVELLVVTALQVRAGANALAVNLASGWYAGGIGWFGPHPYGQQPALLAQLKVTYEDGSTERVVSAPGWRAAAGPVIDADLMAGEEYDARRETEGWTEPGFDDSGWLQAEPVGAVRAEPVVQLDRPVEVVRELTARKVTEPRPGVFVFDLGQNMVGSVRLKVSGPAGTTVRLRHAEALNPDGSPYTANLRSARATDRYTLKGGGPESRATPRPLTCSRSPRTCWPGTTAGPPPTGSWS
ncbi:hypothetical protein ACVWYT_007837 [Streptomyces sp. TE4109]